MKWSATPPISTLLVTVSFHYEDLDELNISSPIHRENNEYRYTTLQLRILSGGQHGEVYISAYIKLQQQLAQVCGSHRSNLHADIGHLPYILLQ